jgi:diadenosine tetraphosphate (Ap4A) HIT family hydrolase
MTTPITLRTTETEEAYTRAKAAGALEKGCPLCDEREAIAEFEHWRMVPNLYPYDRIAKVHHMLVSRRHATDAELTEEEQKEFDTIKEEYAQTHYNFMIEPMRKRKSIPAHSHVHFIIEIG